MLKLIKRPHRKQKKGCTNPIVFTVTGGKEYSIKELAKHVGICAETIRDRVKNLGWRHPHILDKSLLVNGDVAMNSSAGLIETLIQNDKVCPIMQGSTNLRITRKGFKKACGFHQERQAGNNNKYSSNRYCAICKGKDIPKGVDFITIKEFDSFKRGR